MKIWILQYPHLRYLKGGLKPLPVYDGSSIFSYNRWKIVANDPILRSLKDRLKRMVLGDRWNIIFIDLVLRSFNDWSNSPLFLSPNNHFFNIRLFTIIEISLNVCEYLFYDRFLWLLNSIFHRSCFTIVQRLFLPLLLYCRRTIMCSEPFPRSLIYRS